jgi:hypothetical protein
VTSDVKPRALLDHGPHVQRLLAELSELRGEVTRVRDWLANRPADTDPAAAVRAVVRLRELRLQACDIYQELLKAHEIHPLPRQTAATAARWAIEDFTELITEVVTATAPNAAAAEPGEPT